MSTGKVITFSKDQLSFFMSSAIYHAREAARKVVAEELAKRESPHAHTSSRKRKPSQPADKRKKARPEYPVDVQEEVVREIREILASSKPPRSWFRKFETEIWSSIVNKPERRHLSCPSYSTVYGWINRVRMTQRAVIVYDGNHEDKSDSKGKGNGPSNEDLEEQPQAEAHDEFWTQNALIC